MFPKRYRFEGIQVAQVMRIRSHKVNQAVIQQAIGGFLHARAVLGPQAEQVYLQEYPLFDIFSVLAGPFV